MTVGPVVVGLDVVEEGGGTVPALHHATDSRENG